MSDFQNVTNVKVNSFTKGMVKDISDQFLPEGAWTHAINAVNVTHTGEKGKLSNEQATETCVDDAQFTIIGAIHYEGSRWMIFTTNDTTSSIEFFDQDNCSSEIIVKNDCLGFKRSHPITGASKLNSDCSISVYFADGLNPDRYINPSDIPYVPTGNNLSSDPDCFIPEYSSQLDCDKLRLARYVKPACVKVSKSRSSGQLLNGMYQIAVAYTINEQRCSDYYISNPIALWEHNGTAGSLDISIDADPTFDDMEVVVISVINNQTVAKRLGYYSTRQNSINVDVVAQELPTVPTNLIPLISPIYEKSDRIYSLNSYLIRQGVTTYPDFNYQPLANNITTKYAVVKYPADYYKDGGHNTGYMRDEVYSFFIRWIYDTGAKSASYHIPGRAAVDTDRDIITSNDVVDGNERWRVYDTATYDPGLIFNQILPDLGEVVGKGLMQFWESSEIYDDDRPDIWGPLCGKPIRHHKFPADVCPHIHDENGNIYILGVEFDNIQHPLDFDGNPIQNIVGYEILRGSREGNKSVVAKGIFNNTFEYNIQGRSDVKGLMQNYPYNDLRPDEFLRKDFNFARGVSYNNNKLDTYKRNYLTFHSPETTFNKPYLGSGYISIYRELSGKSVSQYQPSYKHPKEILLNNSAVSGALVVGLSIGVLAAMGSVTTTRPTTPVFAAASGGGPNFIPTSQRQSGPGTILADIVEANFSLSTLALDGATVATLLAGTIATSLSLTYYAALGMDQVFTAIYNLSSPRDYVYQIDSHGFYNNPLPSNRINRTLENNSARYVDSSVQDYIDNYRINNLFRNKHVIVKTFSDVPDPTFIDTSRSVRIGSPDVQNINKSVSRNISTRYGAYKVSYDNQYGQLESIRQIPIPMCVQYTTANVSSRYKSDILFGGDIYINRYTEKNPYLFFNAWMLGEPDLTPFDYRNAINGPYPQYWADFNKFDVGSLIMFFNFVGGSVSSSTPSDSYNLDRLGYDGGFVRDNAVMYTSVNGVRDFYVESEYDLSKRDYGDSPEERHYEKDSYTDIRSMFRMDRITRGNFYKYDLSLSVSKLYGKYISWGAMVPRSYDPTVADTCYTYYGKRLIYSLQHRLENKKDNWLAYLANNYKDFDRRICSIKSLNKTGAVMLFEDGEPLQVLGVDTLETSAGLKFTIGDGGLFQQPLQSLANADDTIEYGACQNFFSTINTPFGLFYVSQKAGKIFQYAGSLMEISSMGMKQWFAEYLPSRLLKQYPNYPYYDNPIFGVGCQAIYDPEYKLVYFTKKDYKLRSDAPHQLFYNDNIGFYYRDESLPNPVVVELGDPAYFEDCSFTISYDPEEKYWVSFHDWHPELVIPGYDHFFTTKTLTGGRGGIFKHNSTYSLFCNYYGVNYPWEVEIPIITGTQVTTLRSIEYYLENYKYYNDGFDRFSPLDANFDRAIIHNSEQASGVLELNIKPKNNPTAGLQYPIINPNSISILFSKEENKYRFNQFWDITNNRNEFGGADIAMWRTRSNGYIRNLNPVYINYNKPVLQRKKFRHYGNKLILRKNISGEINMQLLVTYAKQNLSQR